MQVDILLNRKFVDKVDALEHEAYSATTILGALDLLELAHGFAIEPVLSAIWIVKQTKDVEQSRLAATARSHYRYKLAVFDVYANTVEGNGLHFLCTEDFCKVFCLYHSLYSF